MTQLSRWLRAQMASRSLSQLETALQAHVGVGTVSDILREGHVPKIDTLFRLADFFGTPRAELLLLAAGLAPESAHFADPRQEDFMIEALLEEFRRLPDEWKPEAVSQVRFMARLAAMPTRQVIGDEEEASEEQGSEDEAQEEAAA